MVCWRLAILVRLIVSYSFVTFKYVGVLKQKVSLLRCDSRLLNWCAKRQVSGYTAGERLAVDIRDVSISYC